MHQNGGGLQPTFEWYLHRSPTRTEDLRSPLPITTALLVLFVASV